MMVQYLWFINEKNKTKKMAVVMSSGWRLWFDDNMMPKDGYSQCLYDILCEFDLNLKNEEINSH
ncbi:hypothetical protein [Clostridium sp.]|uniref:hypothetical protein n=1 Tax=Clostridium sp. TaxID=1506 RepID=UPI003D6C9799